MARGRKTGSRDFVKGDPRAGRPKGAKDKRPRAGSIRAVYQDFIENRDGHDKMVNALDDGIQSSKRALGYMELGARVLDRVDDKNGNRGAVTINFISNIRPARLRAAAVRARRPALRPAEAQNPPAFPLSRENSDPAGRNLTGHSALAHRPITEEAASRSPSSRSRTRPDFCVPRRTPSAPRSSASVRLL